MACFCSGACRRLGYCPAGGAPPFPPFPSTAPPLEVGRTHRQPLTEEDVRRILREELKRALKGRR